MKEQRLSLDIISTLPENIIETILCLLPIQDAVRTSILSSDWRYNWTKIPKLVFDYKDMFKKVNDENQMSILEQSFEEPPSERKHLGKRCKVFYAVYQVLLLHQGPIREFTLSVNANDTSVEIDQIIRHLSKNDTLRKLTLHMKYVLRYKVPVSVFSLHRLTHLDLRECNIEHRRAFDVCGTLTSLYMEDVNINSLTLLHLLCRCPVLKSLTVLSSCYHIEPDGLISPGYFTNYDRFTVIDLFECLPVVEHLSVSIWVIKCFVEDEVPRELPTKLVHLKYLYLEAMCFVNKYGLPCLGLLIRCSPNVEKIKLQIRPDLAEEYSQSEIHSVKLEDYSDIWLEHLNELEIEDFANLKPELEFVKLILAKAPVLKKVRIVLYNEVAKDEELKMLRILLCSTRASSAAKIFVERPV